MTGPYAPRHDSRAPLREGRGVSRAAAFSLEQRGAAC